MLKDIYVVLSRDNGLIHVTINEIEANNVKFQQIKDEEIRGGRPSVYVKKTKIDLS